MAWAVSSSHAGAAPPDAVLPSRRYWRMLVNALFAPYRPERHYMRGPGPKWREKHGRLSERRREPRPRR